MNLKSALELATLISCLFDDFEFFTLNCFETFVCEKHTIWIELRGLIVDNKPLRVDQFANFEFDILDILLAHGLQNIPKVKCL